MIKKILIALLAALPLAASAQLSLGKWVTHTRFAISSTQNVIDTKDKVYSLVNNSLYCFDKSTKAQTVLSNQNQLSGTLISGIYYNNDKKYLVATYDDSNIDIIAENGKVTNIPNIKDAVMTQSRIINDVTFSGDKIFVATGFGFVVIDDTKMRITETRVYSYNISSVAEVGKWRIVFLPNQDVFYCPTNSVPEWLNGYKKTTIANMVNGKILAINDATILVKQDKRLTKVTIADSGTDEATFTSTSLVEAAPTNVQKTATGYLANFFAAKYYYTFDAEGGNAVKKTFTVKELVSCAPDGDGTLWGVNEKGVHSYAATDTYYKPNAVSINGVPFWMGYNKNTHKLYLTATSDNGILPKANVGAVCEINKFDGTSWESANPTVVAGTQGWYWPEFDPLDTTDTYYIHTRAKFLIKVVDNTVVKQYTDAISPTKSYKGAYRFDNAGNLWLVNSWPKEQAPVKVLPHDKVVSNDVSISDWTTYPINDVLSVATFKRSILDISNKSNIKVFNAGDYICPLIVWRNNPDLSTGEYETKSFTSLTASDGSTCSWVYSWAIKADLDDNIVFGFDKGLVMFKATDAFNEGFTVEKAKSLEGTSVYTVEVDTLNRKWVGTGSDGLYLLSPDCKTVINHYTSSNSPLLTNVVYQVCCNTDNNSVFVVTPLGVQQFFSDYTESATDYSNVYAYPNPVRPDFTGYITITGLMEGSNVVIKDAKGNVVKQFTGANGSVAWDGCNEAGERLQTGNYGVFAAQEGAQMPEQPYTKVMIIK